MWIEIKIPVNRKRPPQHKSLFPRWITKILAPIILVPNKQKKTLFNLDFCFIIGEKKLAADTKDMRTQWAKISNLEEGVYSFHLKVADAKGQSSGNFYLGFIQ